MGPSFKSSEGDQTDYRLKRGLAHLLGSDFSTFEVGSPLAPAELRRRVFAVSAPSVPNPQQSAATLTEVANALTRELGRDIAPEHIRAWVYADLPEAHVLTSFEAPTPEVLLERDNLAQAQGALYRASHVVITAHRNDPGESKPLFRYLKRFGLMAYKAGDPVDHFVVRLPTLRGGPVALKGDHLGQPRPSTRARQGGAGSQAASLAATMSAVPCLADGSGLHPALGSWKTRWISCGSWAWLPCPNMTESPPLATMRCARARWVSTVSTSPYQPRIK